MIFITFKNCDKTCSKIEKNWSLFIQWVAKIMKNPEAVIRFPQWCNLTFTPWFYITKVCLEESKIPKYVCLITQLGEQLLEKQILKFFLDTL